MTTPPKLNRRVALECLAYQRKKFNQAVKNWANAKSPQEKAEGQRQIKLYWQEVFNIIDALLLVQD